MVNIDFVFDNGLIGIGICKVVGEGKVFVGKGYFFDFVKNGRFFYV